MKVKEEKLSIYNAFWIFIIGSVLGWFIEGLFTLISQHILINHSALVIGPFNIIYGFGAVLLTALLLNYKDRSLWLIFLLSFIGGSVLEYICSWGMELFVGFTAWDYSNHFLNLNGRICLLYSLYWGFLGIIWIKYIYPLFIKIIHLWSYELGHKVGIWLAIFLVLDAGITITAVMRAKEKEKQIPPSNMYEELLDQTFNQKYLNNMFCNKWS